RPGGLTRVSWGLSVLLAAAALTACGDDEGEGTGGGSSGTESTSGTTTTASSTGQGGGGEACPGVDTSGCDVVVAPGEDVTETLQEALIEGVQSGGTLCLCPGEYMIETELSLTIPDVTVRGVGATREDVVLDFAAQTSGDD